MIKDAIAKLIRKEDLTEEEISFVIKDIMDGKTTNAQIGAFLVSLSMKGETVQEITGAAKVLRAKVKRLRVVSENVVDTCGTGGDKTGTFNISTASAFVLAGAGLTVAKHGNRAVSSKCGSADVLEALGVNISIDADKVRECVDTIGIGFLFAPSFHLAMKHVAVPRRELGVRTIFNLIGPLTNPAFVNAQVLGVFDSSLTEKMAQVLNNLGSKHVMVVNGCDGLDELTITGESRVSELRDGKVKTYNIKPEDLGMNKSDIDRIRGGTPKENADIILDVLKGECGPKRDIVLLNSAAGLIVGDKVDSFKEGIALAGEIIDSGKALQRLIKLRTCL